MDTEGKGAAYQHYCLSKIEHFYFAATVGSRIRLGPLRASEMAHLDTVIMPQLTETVFGQPGFRSA